MNIQLWDYSYIEFTLLSQTKEIGISHLSGAIKTN